MSSDFDEQSDTDLLKAIANSDSDAFMSLYDRYSRIAFGLAYRILGDQQRAEEVVQDAFMQVWNRAEGFDFNKSGNVRGWTLTIVHHRAIDTHRRNHRHDTKATTLDDHLDLRSAADTWEDVSTRLTRDDMQAALQSLPVDQRRAVELAYFGGLTQSEIAAQEDMPLGTVKGRLRLGLNKMRTVLVANDGEYSSPTQG